MESKRDKAKRLFKSGRYHDAAPLIFDLIKDIETSNRHLELAETTAKLYIKLADCNMMMKMYSKSETQYRNSIKIQPTAKCYYKYANLLAIHLSMYDTALIMYQHAIRLNPNHATTHSKIGITYNKMKRFEKAEKHFQIAMHLAPQNITILTEYSSFLQQHKQYKLALEHIQKAISIFGTTAYPYLEQRRHDLYHAMDGADNQNNSIQHDVSTKIIVYDFDETLTSQNVNRVTDCNRLDYMRRHDIIREIFGGQDRVNRLTLHLERVSKSYTIAIVSFNTTDVITHCLQMSDLLSFFASINIIGSDTFRYSDKVDPILSLQSPLALNPSQYLLIDDQYKNIDVARRNGIETYHVQSYGMLHGLNIYQMDEIEQLLSVYVAGESSWDLPAPPPSLPPTAIDDKEVNKKSNIYNHIKLQTRQMNMDEHDAKEEINIVCQFLKTTEYWKHSPYQPHFIYFSEIYKILIRAKKDEMWFTAAHLLPTILNITRDAELILLNATLNKYYQHFEQADQEFKNALECSNRTNRGNVQFEYACFLYDCDRFKEAEPLFSHVLDDLDNETVQEEYDKAKLYLMYARTLEALGMNEERVIQCYELALECAGHGGDKDRYTQYDMHRALANNFEHRNDKVDDVFSKEFDRFWFDEICTQPIGFNDNAFNEYHARFWKENLNNIRRIIFGKNMEQILRDKIGVRSEHFNRIWSAFQALKQRHTEFKKIIRSAKLTKYMPLFEWHGIFTMDSFLYMVGDTTDIKDMIIRYNKDPHAKTKYDAKAMQLILTNLYKDYVV
eukprot:330360_1